MCCVRQFLRINQSQIDFILTFSKKLYALSIPISHEEYYKKKGKSSLTARRCALDINIYIYISKRICRLAYSTLMLLRIYIYNLEGVTRCVYTTSFKLFTIQRGTLAPRVREPRKRRVVLRTLEKDGIRTTFQPFFFYTHHKRYAIECPVLWGVLSSSCGIITFGIVSRRGCQQSSHDKTSSRKERRSEMLYTSLLWLLFQSKSKRLLTSWWQIFISFLREYHRVGWLECKRSLFFLLCYYRKIYCTTAKNIYSLLWPSLSTERP